MKNSAVVPTEGGSWLVNGRHEDYITEEYRWQELHNSKMLGRGRGSSLEDITRNKVDTNGTFRPSDPRVTGKLTPQTPTLDPRGP